MSWVRSNTSENAVFAHWWDYGYWVQSIGERATVLDGSNSIGYWNHLMGRLVLTGTDERQSLDFLYTHNATHLLIDSTDIGKYTAFSSIGSDENYDRISWISTFLMDQKQTQETSNSTVYVYVGGTSVDDDIIWNQNGQQIFLPKKSAGLGAILLAKKNETFLQPEWIFIYNGNQYRIPLRYMYINGKLQEFNSGLDAGIFVFPTVEPTSSGGVNLNEFGALLYLSNKTIHTNLANLYLFNKDSQYFKIAHTENDQIIENLRSQGLNIGEFAYYQGVRGPIKIWEIKYPTDVKFNAEYLRKDFPNPQLEVATPGEY
jgi:hypothetical protein